MYFDLRRQSPAWETQAVDVTAAILAGGRGTRIGGDKAMVELAGRPLVHYPIQAARAAGLNVVVVAKRTTRLPRLTIPLLLEPDEPSHPLLGIVTALEHHRAIIAIPCDMPFVQPLALAALAEMTAELAILVPEQPFPALYRDTLLPQLRDALGAGRSVRSTQARPSLAPESASSTDPATRLTVNTPEDLARAEARVSRP